MNILNFDQLTNIMARNPEKLIKLCTLLLYSGITAISLISMMHTGTDSCGFWQYLICKSSEDSIKESAEGLSLVIHE